MTMKTEKTTMTDQAITDRPTKERPILFSGPMVRAILEGRKTQTRRVVKDKHRIIRDHRNKPMWPIEAEFLKYHPSAAADLCPYGQPGERLWVRENLYNDGDGSWMYEDTKYVFLETGLLDYPDMEWKRRNQHKGGISSIYMPRHFSRITLEVTGIRVERLQDISAADAVAEGTRSRLPENGISQSEYRDLWQLINGPESWSTNPWVWVIEFKRVRPSSQAIGGEE